MIYNDQVELTLNCFLLASLTTQLDDLCDHPTKNLKTLTDKFQS
ncbi:MULTISPECIES: hypothetical protein [Fischerella]|jgi:hypothetical protein|nr:MULTISPECIES: hypothetical protein [Fischerella]